MNVRAQSVFEWIPVNKAVYNPLNLRGMLRSPDQIKRTAASIREVGLLHHPIVSLTPHGWMIVAGEQRFQAMQFLAREGYAQFEQVFCKTLEGISEEIAMKILAEENFAHGTLVPAATANEVYWHIGLICNLPATTTPLWPKSRVSGARPTISMISSFCPGGCCIIRWLCTNSWPCSAPAARIWLTRKCR